MHFPMALLTLGDPFLITYITSLRNNVCTLSVCLEKGLRAYNFLIYVYKTQYPSVLLEADTFFIFKDLHFYYAIFLWFNKVSQLNTAPE